MRTLLLAHVLALPGLREIVRRFGPALGTANFSSLAPALACFGLLVLAQRLTRHLLRAHPPAPGFHLVPVDSMALSLTTGRGRACAPLNDRTRGGGVLWAVWLKASPGASPLQILSRMRGAWSDSKLIRAARLIAHGPLYLLDRNFYALDLIAGWLARGVRFIVRGRKNQVLLAPDTICGPPRRIGAIQVLRDEIGRLGRPQRGAARPRVRLVWARLSGGEDLILLSDRLAWDAGRLLAAYHQRGKIEPFHRLIKQQLGLAHLYSLQPGGLELLLEVAVLLVLLLALSGAGTGRTVPARLRTALEALRAGAGLSPTRWRPNTPPGHRGGPARAKGGEA